AVRAVLLQALEEVGAERPVRGGQVAVLDGQQHRLRRDAERREAGGGKRAVAAQRRDEALAGGQVAERVAAGDLAVVGEASAAGQVEREVGAVRARDVRG